MILLCVTQTRIYRIVSETLPRIGEYICYNSHYINEHDVTFIVLEVTHNLNKTEKNNLLAKVIDKDWLKNIFNNGVDILLYVEKV